ncbi:hypothetical protein AQJ11_14800 [Streptomyces corchorusii]|uniref:Uncharacterized protein n=1 Tax=Streptomyces corchorusii TaxID=1903 RepID=A0A101QDE3_STRCK|nr:hypothetical protein AQJ11_14800 [Streptomyces corchorusii]
MGARRAFGPGGCCDQQVLLAGERHRFHVPAPWAPGGDDQAVPAGPHLLQQRLGQPLRDPQPDPVGDEGHQRGQRPHAEQLRRAGGVHGHGLPGRRAGALRSGERVQRTRRPDRELVGGRGGFHTARQPRERLPAGLLLQGADLGGHSRL